MVKERNINISLYVLVMVAVLYLVVPILLFIIAWTRTLFAVPASALLIVATVLYLRQCREYRERKISISPAMLLISFVLILFFAWICNVGGFTVASFDSPWRDALLNDLTEYSWPVIYPETGNRLIYYYIYWLVPALVGKILGTSTVGVAFLLWFGLGFELVYLLICAYIGQKNREIMYVVLFLLFFFGGLKVIGEAYVEILNIYPYKNSLIQINVAWCDWLFNGYSFNWFFRMNYDAVSNIVNQVIPVWLTAVLVLMNRERVENYAYLGLLLLPYAPLPFMGIFVLLIGMGLLLGITGKQDVLIRIRQGLSMQNILISIVIVPIMGTFFGANSTVSSESGGFMLLPFELFDRTRIVTLIVFYILEFGVYCIIISQDHRKDPVYYIVLVCLLASPLIEFGKRGGRDFVMNFSFPFLFILMVWIAEYINDHVIQQVLTGKSLFLIGCVFLAAFSPISGILSRFDTMVDVGSVTVKNDYVRTAADKSAEWNVNFLVAETSMGTWKHIERKKSKRSIERDIQVFEEYQRQERNQIVEGHYSISPITNTDEQLGVAGENLYVGKEESKIKLAILYGQSILQSEDNGLAVDVPDGIVDENGSIRGYERNDSGAQRFNIIKLEDGYNITYGEYFLTYKGDKVFLSLKDPEDVKSQIWVIAQKK